MKEQYPRRQHADIRPRLFDKVRSTRARLAQAEGLFNDAEARYETIRRTRATDEAVEKIVDCTAEVENAHQELDWASALLNARGVTPLIAHTIWSVKEKITAMRRGEITADAETKPRQTGTADSELADLMREGTPIEELVARSDELGSQCQAARTAMTDHATELYNSGLSDEQRDLLNNLMHSHRIFVETATDGVWTQALVKNPYVAYETCVDAWTDKTELRAELYDENWNTRGREEE